MFSEKIVMSISVCLQSKKLDKESARSLVFLLYRSEYYSLYLQYRFCSDIEIIIVCSRSAICALIGLGK